MPVPGKKCAQHITRNEKRKGARAEKKFVEFLVAVYRGEVQMKGYHIEPAPPGEAEAMAKKAWARIKGRGLGTLEMFCIGDEFDEYWRGDWKVDKKKKQLVRGKGEKHRRAGENSKKSVKARAEKRRAREDDAIAAYIQNCIKGNSPLGFR